MESATSSIAETLQWLLAEAPNFAPFSFLFCALQRITSSQMPNIRSLVFVRLPLTWPPGNEACRSANECRTLMVFAQFTQSFTCCIGCSLTTLSLYWQQIWYPIGANMRVLSDNKAASLTTAAACRCVRSMLWNE